MVTSSQLDGGFLADFNRIAWVVSRCRRRLKVVGSNPTQRHNNSNVLQAAFNTFNVQPSSAATDHPDYSVEISHFFLLH